MAMPNGLYLNMNKQNKRGRPRKDVTREITCRVRLTSDENTMLTDAAKSMNKTKSEMIREALVLYFDTINVYKNKKKGFK